MPENLEQELDERSDFGKEVARQFSYVAVNKRRPMIAEQEGNGSRYCAVAKFNERRIHVEEEAHRWECKEEDLSRDSNNEVQQS